MPNKTTNSLGVKKTDGQQSVDDARLEMTDRDRDRFQAALDRPPKPLPELERPARLHARATSGDRSTAMSRLFAYLSRMKFIRRWGLMYNTYPENIQEHSLRVAMIAHALAIIRNRPFNGSVNPERSEASDSGYQRGMMRRLAINRSTR